jgi:di/tricarboxylate transporter
MLAIFVATIVGIITKPLPMGAIALFGIAATAISGTLSRPFSGTNPEKYDHCPT